MTGYETVGRFVPRGLLSDLGESLIMAGMDVSPESFSGMALLACIGVAALSLALSGASGLPGYAVALLPIAAAGIVALGAYLLIILRIESRKNQVEASLPDFLHIASSNVRAGMPLDQALWFAARPEFGLLSQEIELVAKRTFGGESLSQTLERLSFRFDSQLLKRTVRLISHGASSGAEMAGILEDTANDVRRIQLMRKDITAGMLMYVIFITFSAVVGAPFLYSVSYKLISVLERVWGQVSSSGPMPSVGFLIPSSPGVTPEQFFWFSLSAITITSLIASFIVSVIQTGSKKNGVKYVPMFWLAGTASFLLVTALLNMLTR